MRPDYRCLQCDRRLCEVCKSEHDAIPACHEHTVEYIGDSENELRCHLHKNVVNYFCKACLVPVCVDCVLLGLHKTHQDAVLELGKAIKDEQMSLENITEQLEISILKVAESQNLFEETARVINIHVEAAKRRAEEEGEMLIKELHQKLKIENNAENSKELDHARCVLNEVEYTINQNDAKMLESVKTIKPKAEATVTLLGELIENIQEKVRFLPAKPLAAGSIVGSLKHVSDEEERPPDLPQRPGKRSVYRFQNVMLVRKKTKLHNFYIHFVLWSKHFLCNQRMKGFPFLKKTV